MRRSSIAVLVSLVVLTGLLSPAPGAQADPPSEPPGASGRAAGYEDAIWLLDRKIRTARIDEGELARARAARESTHAVVQLHRLPAPGDLDRLRELGITPLSYLNGRAGAGTAYLAALSPDVADREALSELVRGVHALLPGDKVDPVLGRTGATRSVLVTFFSDVSPQRAEEVLARVGASGTASGASTYSADLDNGQVHRLATEDAVQFQIGRAHV